MKQFIQSMRGPMSWAALGGLALGAGVTQTIEGALWGVLVGAGSVVVITLIRNRVRAARPE